MATVRTHLAHARPLPSVKPVRISTPLKSSVTGARPILPNFSLTSILPNRPGKKRVRFELKLEAVEEEEDPALLNHENSVVSLTKANKRIIDSWREERLLHSAYIRNLEKQTTATPLISGIKRPSRPSLSPESDDEASIQSRPLVVENKASTAVIDLFTVTTPPFHLPAIVHGTTATNKKGNINDRRHSVTFMDSSLRQRVQLATPPRYMRPRKPTNSVGVKSYLSPMIKRIDLTLPTVKDQHSNEKFIRIDHPIGTKMIHEHFHSKKAS